LTGTPLAVGLSILAREFRADVSTSFRSCDMRNWMKLASLGVVVALAGAVRADDKPKEGDKPTGDDKTMTETHFVDHAYTGCQNELLLARLAQQRARNEEVRKFAIKMIEEHNKGNQALILIVSKQRIAVPDKPLKEQQKDLDRLHSNEVKDFDKEYMECIVRDHEKAIEMFERAAKELKNEELKEFASKAVPALKEHLALAKEVRGKLAGGSGVERTGAEERTGARGRDDGKALSDNEFVTKAASSGLAEVAIGKLGQEKAKNADVKKFAERVVTDHSKANEELIRIAKDSGITVPDKPSTDHEQHVKHFSEGSARDFDKAFVNHMVQSHTKGVDLFTKGSKELTNEKLRGFAEKTLPTLKEHLEIAKKLQGQLGRE
jgi:putative membrane protein